MNIDLFLYSLTEKKLDVNIYFFFIYRDKTSLKDVGNVFTFLQNFYKLFTKLLAQYITRLFLFYHYLYHLKFCCSFR